jgi:flagellar assembly factor FliW
MQINSTRFGEVQVDEQDILRFSEGILGFPDEKVFALLPYQEDSPFAVLQSAVEPNLTFFLVDPFSFFADYSFELEDEIAKELKLSDENPPRIVSIVTLSEKMGEMTANLLAPIIINQRDRVAVQIVHGKTSYTTRHRLFPQNKDLMPQDAKGGE